MTEETQIAVSMDTLPNILRMPSQIEQYKNALRKKLENDLDGMVKRHQELPAYMIGHGGYSELLDEARKLYIEGKFYSCVAMSGITAERIAKDLLFTIIKFEQNGQSNHASIKQLKYLDKIDLSIILELLFTTGVIDQKTKKAFIAMAELRNIYAHGIGINKDADAKKAINYLHIIIDGSVSIWKFYTTKDGKLVEKNKTSTNSAHEGSS